MQFDLAHVLTVIVTGAIILGQLVLHVSEIWIFGIGYFVMANAVDFGSLEPSIYAMTFPDYI